MTSEILGHCMVRVRRTTAAVYRPFEVHTTSGMVNSPTWAVQATAMAEVAQTHELALVTVNGDLLHAYAYTRARVTSGPV